MFKNKSEVIRIWYAASLTEDECGQNCPSDIMVEADKVFSQPNPYLQDLVQIPDKADAGIVIICMSDMDLVPHDCKCCNNLTTSPAISWWTATVHWVFLTGRFVLYKSHPLLTAMYDKATSTLLVLCLPESTLLLYDLSQPLHQLTLAFRSLHTVVLCKQRTVS